MKKVKPVHVIRVEQATPERRKELRQLTIKARKNQFPFLGT